MKTIPFIDYVTIIIHFPLTIFTMTIAYGTDNGIIDSLLLYHGPSLHFPKNISLTVPLISGWWFEPL